MKRLLMAMLFSFASLVLISQAYTVGVSGFVEDVNSGEPIENQMVQVYTDSIPDDFYYFNILWTDENGFFTDSFEVPSGVSGNLLVATPGCQGVMLVEEVTYSENNTDFTFSFLSCSDPGGGGEECEAMFYYYPAENSMSTIHFIDISNGNPDSWSWEFGDGNTSSEQNPIHTYNELGDYFVNLTISSDSLDCTSTVEMLVRVGDTNWFPDSCQAQFYYYPAFDSLPSGNTNAIQFIDYSLGNPTSWDWDFGDGNLSTEQNPLHIYADTGFYEVCLTIANPVDSCYSTYCQEVFVFDDTLADCLAWFEYEISELTVDFSGWSMGNEWGEFSWDFGDGTSGTGQTISHTYGEEGLYTVIMTYSDTTNDCFVTYTSLILLGDDFSFLIYGNVFLDDSLMADYADVYLMAFDTIDGELVSIAETEIDEYGYYEFDDISTENCLYFIQADLQEASAYYGDYLPTYHYDALNWQDAWPVFPFPSGMSYNIMMVAADGPDAGEGQVYGVVSNEVSRDVLANVQIVLMDEYGIPIACTRTNDDGYFSFDNLAYGTYFIHTEMPGVEGEPAAVNLHQENTSESLNIIIKDGEALLGLNDPLSATVQSIGNVFPNPASESAIVEIEMKESARVTATLRSSLGNILEEKQELYSSGLQKIRFDLSGLPKGIYFIDISLDDRVRVVKKLVKL